MREMARRVSDLLKRVNRKYTFIIRDSAFYPLQILKNEKDA